MPCAPCRTTRRSFSFKNLRRRDAGIDAVIAVYHVDHRELCAHERDWPFQILNLLEVVGASMGLGYPDHYKRLKLLQDVYLIVADSRELLAHHCIGEHAPRAALTAMLHDHPLSLRVNAPAAACASA